MLMVTNTIPGVANGRHTSALVPLQTRGTAAIVELVPASHQ